MQIHPGLLMFYSFSGFAEPDCLSWTPPTPPHLTLFVVSHSNRIMHDNVTIRHVQMLIKEDTWHKPGGAAPSSRDSGELSARCLRVRFIPCFQFVGAKQSSLISSPHSSYLSEGANGIFAIFILELLWLDNPQIASWRSLLHYWQKKAVCQPSHHPWWLTLCWTPSYSSLHTTHPPQHKFSFLLTYFTHSVQSVCYSCTFCCFELVLQHMWSLWPEFSQDNHFIRPKCQCRHILAAWHRSVIQVYRKLKIARMAARKTIDTISISTKMCCCEHSRAAFWVNSGVSVRNQTIF